MRGLAAVSVATDPAQFRGVLPLPISALGTEVGLPGVRESSQPQPRHSPHLRPVPVRLREFVEIKNRGHGLTIDSGWREVADTALAFVKRFA